MLSKIEPVFACAPETPVDRFEGEISFVPDHGGFWQIEWNLPTGPTALKFESLRHAVLLRDVVVSVVEARIAEAMSTDKTRDAGARRECDPLAPGKIFDMPAQIPVVTEVLEGN